MEGTASLPAALLASQAGQCSKKLVDPYHFQVCKQIILVRVFKIPSDPYMTTYNLKDNPLFNRNIKT
jgi:hypothetical protein